MPNLTIELSDQQFDAINAELKNRPHQTPADLIQDALTDYLSPIPAPTHSEMLAEINAMHDEIENNQPLLDPETVRQQITGSLNR